MAELPVDIANRVASDFPVEMRDGMVRRLSSFDARVARCILFLADRDIAKFHHFCEAAHHDPRDVMSWAEYVRDDEHVRDFRRPFGT